MFLRAQLGKLDEAQHYLAAYHPEVDSNIIRTFWDAPMLRAILALENHKPAEALHLLEPARPYHLCNFYVPYFRAKAETEAACSKPPRPTTASSSTIRV